MKPGRGFTLIELLLAMSLLGVVMLISMLTFNTVSRGWQESTDYIDKTQRTDYALNQVVSGLRSMYYPHDGKTDERYGFVLVNKGDGEEPDESDVIEWSKTGSAIVGNRNAIADTVHRVQVMVLEEGNNDYREEIQKTGLYARLCGDQALRPKDDEDDRPDKGYGFDNDELYQPILISDGVIGFNCRVLAKEEDRKEGIRHQSENDRKSFEDEYAESNSVPFKVELTFYVADSEGNGRRENVAPMVKIVRIPIHEQSLDGSETPTGSSKGGKGNGKNQAVPPPAG